MAPDRAKGANEVFCRSCGEPIKQNAEICPHCGVRNTHSSTGQSRGSTTGQRSRTASRPGSSTSNQAGSTAPNQSASTSGESTRETTVSDTWWYGVAGGAVLWVLLFVVSATVGGLGAFGDFLALVAWIGLPVAAYYDMQYVRANSDWDPNTVIWVVLLLVPLVNVVTGGVYLYRRHEVLGEP